LSTYGALVGCGGGHASSPAEVTDASGASGGDAGGLEDASGTADVGGGSDAGGRGGPDGRWLCDQPQWGASERQAYASESWANLQHPPSLRVAAGAPSDLPHVNFPRKAQAWTMRVGEAPVHGLATHFDYGSGAAGAREGSARALLEVLPDGARAVVLGDLNATPDSAAYVTLSAALRDLWGEARPGVSGETVPAEAPTRRIDYVFASATFGPVRDAVLLDERDGDTWLSDHLGVAVTVAWEP
jgi:endonuclease/exonuclease/phosphatase family metal-dependent hydrolase